MIRVRGPLAFLLVALPLVTACGSSPATPGTTGTVSLVLFYDEKGSGALDSNDVVRLPNVQVDVSGQAGTTDAHGQVTLTSVPAGIQTVNIHTPTLPPFYEPGAVAKIQIPGESGSTLDVPVILPIGANVPNTYMAFGDSITIGDGSTDGTGYRGPLEAQLQAYFGGAPDEPEVVPSPPASPPPDTDPDAARIVDEGIEATRTNKGAARIASTLDQATPAFTLIHYGTNDWNEHACQVAPPCYTIDNLRLIVEAVKAKNSLPFLATIIPVNVGYDDRVPPQRQVWVHNQDALIRTLASQEGAVLVDLEAAFLSAAAQNGGDLKPLFSDHVHPSDAGYAIMTATFFKAITERASASGSTAGVGGLVSRSGGGPAGSDRGVR